MEYYKYENTLPYGLTPTERMAIKSLHDNTLEEFVGTHKEYQTLANTLVQEYSTLEKEAKTKYWYNERVLQDLFWKDAFEELGIPADHPKADKLKSFAWDKGHSGGYSAVFYYLNSAWDLVKE